MPRAGLTPATVTEAGAVLADEIGIDHVSMGLVAERLGVKTPSLYKHVTGLADLNHRIAVQAVTELGDAIRDATGGRAGSDALTAAAHTMRTYVKNHPGRYAAGDGARPTGPDDPLISATNRLLASLSAVLHGYRLDPSQQIHALRTLRSMMHGFANLEVAGGFQMSTDIDNSFTWMINLIDQGLLADRSEHCPPRTTDMSFATATPTADQKSPETEPPGLLNTPVSS